MKPELSVLTLVSSCVCVHRVLQVSVKTWSGGNCMWHHTQLVACPWRTRSWTLANFGAKWKHFSTSGPDSVLASSLNCLPNQIWWAVLGVSLVFTLIPESHPKSEAQLSPPLQYNIMPAWNPPEEGSVFCLLPCHWVFQPDSTNPIFQRIFFYCLPWRGSCDVCNKDDHLRVVAGY